jgi:hypothetical protein
MCSGSIFCREVYSTGGQALFKNLVAMNIWKLVLYLEISILVTALISACDLISPAVPAQTEEKALPSTITHTPSLVTATFTQTPTLAPTPTKTSLPSPTYSSTPKLSPTLPVIFTFTPSPTPPPTAKDKITLFLSFIGRHMVGDKFYFHVLLDRENADFVPISISITDQGQISGPFVLVEKSELQFCPSRATSNQSIFETGAIDKSDFPPDFWGRMVQEPFVYHIKIIEVTGAEEVIDITERPGICESIAE